MFIDSTPSRVLNSGGVKCNGATNHVDDKEHFTPSEFLFFDWHSFYKHCTPNGVLKYHLFGI
ncbi:MAG: hypothetical protein ILNGONEN_01222 [Syntrophorhabdaceae bacterium]|nr:hypothetical protein [Syntrophorhabdaceae bacterium]